MPELLHPGVYVQEVPSAVRPIEGVSTSTAAFVGVADRGPIPGTRLPNGRMAQAVLVTSFTDFTRQFGGFRRDSFLAYAVRAFFENGGRRVYIVRVVGRVTSPPTSPPAVAAAQATGTLGGVGISAANEGAWGSGISVVTSASSDADANNFKLVVNYNGLPVESYEPVTFLGSPSLAAGAANPADYVRTVVNSRSEFIAIGGDITAAPGNVTVALTNGQDGPAPQASDFIGAPALDSTPGLPVTGTGLYALDKLTDVNLVAIPGLGDSNSVKTGIEYCKARPLQDCFFVGDVGSVTSVQSARQQGATTDVAKVDDARSYSTGFGGKSAGDFGAIYFPWVLAPDPIGVGRNPRILLPPSGYIAGLYARIDNSRGVFKAPAGTEAGLFGAIGTAIDVSDTEQDRLNPVNVNVIRTVPGAGFVVWGSRTIGSDASWRYVPVRRVAIFLRTSIYYGIQWAVFEPNDEPLWASLRLNIRAFMLTQFRSGAFQGSKPDDAFFVKCDSSTTTQTDIDNGVVNILVGFAALKPAEFVVLKLSQKVNQPAV